MIFFAIYNYTSECGNSTAFAALMRENIEFSLSHVGYNRILSHFHAPIHINITARYLHFKQFYCVRFKLDRCVTSEHRDKNLDFLLVLRYFLNGTDVT